jgi:WD40 repeat protein
MSAPEIPERVTPDHNTGLLWFNDHLFVLSRHSIKEFEASTGLAVSECKVDVQSYSDSCITLPQHGEFMAYSTQEENTITFWDTSTHTRVGLMQHDQQIRAIAFSPDDHLLAIGGNNGKIMIKDLRDVLPPSYSHVSIVYRGIITLPRRGR